MRLSSDSASSSSTRAWPPVQAAWVSYDPSGYQVGSIPPGTGGGGRVGRLSGRALSESRPIGRRRRLSRKSRDRRALGESRRGAGQTSPKIGPKSLVPSGWRSNAGTVIPSPPQLAELRDVSVSIATGVRVTSVSCGREGITITVTAMGQHSIPSGHWARDQLAAQGLDASGCSP